MQSRVVSTRTTRTATLASAFASSFYASNTLTTHAYSVMLPLYFVHTLLCVNMNRFFINRTIGVSCQNFRVLHRAYALIQRGQLRTATLASAFVSSSYASNTLTTHAYSVMLPLYFVDTLLYVNMNRFLLIALFVPAVKISAFYIARTR